MMSTEPSFDEDVHGQAENDSIIHKVKARVSNIFPSVANWFSSPAPSNNNGSIRRRRESESDDESEELESGQDSKVLPQSKRRKSDVLISHQSNTPGTSKNRRLSMPVNATPAAQLMRNRNLIAGNSQKQQMTSSPYDFAARNPSMTLMASPIQINDSDDDENENNEEEETDEVQLVQQEDEEEEIQPVKTTNELKRKGIHETQYNVLRISNNSGDRSTSEPPTRPQNDQAGPSSRGNFRLLGSGLQNEVIPENETEFVMNGNTTNNDEAASEVSESDFTQPPMTTRNHNQGRMSGFLGNRNKNMSASTGQLSFQAHLETEKSLFAEQKRQFNPSVYGSSWSLNSGGSGSRFHRNFSPFYGGKTMYGGAAAYSRRDTRMQQTLRIPTMIRPSSRLSNASSSSSLHSIEGSNASNIVGNGGSNQQNNTTGLSNTSKRILELLDQCTSPLKEARKMGTGLNTSIRVPSLMNNSGLNRSRFNESDLNLSRAVRLTQPKTPYSRPTAPLPTTTELQVPTISQLLQMKRLLNSTAQVKQLASQSKSTLNDTNAYTLPGNDKNNTKYTNKVKEKVASARDKPSTVNDAPDPVNLPNIQLPGLKSVPKIDITITNQSTPTSIFQSSSTSNTTTSNSKMSNNFATLNFATTASSSSLSQDKSKKKNEPETIDISSDDDESKDDEDSDEDEDEDESEENSSSSKSNDSNKFKFSSPVPIQSKPVPSQIQNALHSSDSSKNFKFSNPLSVDSPTNSKLETFKPDMSQAKKKLINDSPKPSPNTSGIASAPELKQGSCLDALFGNKSNKVEEKPLGFGSQFKMASNQWECPSCMIRNDDAKEKCVACNSAKPGASTVKETPKLSGPTPDLLKTTDSGFANLVAAQKAKWECPTCMSQNEQSAEKCLACTEPKPGSSKAGNSSSTAMDSKLPTSGPKMDDAFKKLVEKQKANWQCSSCFTQNEPNRMKCACCEEAKPGSAPEKVPQFSFSSGSTGKFTFGVPKDQQLDLAKTSTTASSSSSSSFVFGIAGKKESENKSGFTFGTPSTGAGIATNSDTKPTFSFGINKTNTSDLVSSSTVNSKPAAIVSGGFSFGAVTSKSEADTSSPNNLKRTFDETDTNKSTSTSTTTVQAPTFTFGKSNEALAKPTSQSSFPGITALGSSNNNTVSSSGGFSFGQNVTSTVTTSTTSTLGVKDDSNQISSTATTNVITTPIFGSGLSGIKPLDRSAFNAKPSDDLNKNKGGLIFGAAKKDEGIKPSTGGFTFGQSSASPANSGSSLIKPADTSSIFGGAAAVTSQQNNNENKSGFSFMNSNSTGNASDKGNEMKSSPAPAFGMFGSAATVNSSPKPSGFAFGSATDQKPATEVQKPVFGSFGAPQSNDTAPKSSIFGGVSTGSTPSNQSPFGFGGASNQSGPPPAYNTQPAPPLSANSSGFNTPTPQPTSNIFGSVNNNNNNNSASSVFGQSLGNQENKLPAFGSISSGNSAFGQSPFGAASNQGVVRPFGSVGGESDEGSNKKLNTGFQFNATGPNTSSTVGSAGSTPYVFGGTPNMDNNNSKGAFNFTPQSKPSFNFTDNSCDTVSGHATTPQDQGNETHSSVRAKNAAASSSTHKTAVNHNRRDHVWINPVLKQQLQAHINKNMILKRKQIGKSESKQINTINSSNNNKIKNKYLFVNSDKKTFSYNKEEINTETSTDNLTTNNTLTSTSSKLLTEPSTQIRTSPFQTMPQQVRHNKKYDRSKFKYVAPKLMISDSDKQNNVNNNPDNNNIDEKNECKDKISKEI
uniref:Nuclear pore complex protein Nup153 n=1 Tax=Culicoides sonorensis TaxID=179676 RepID=A0A336LXF1_CULSO